MCRRAVVKTFSICHDSFSTEQISDRGPYRNQSAFVVCRGYESFRDCLNLAG